MKKLGVVLIIAAIFAMTGCASSGGSSGGSGAAEEGGGDPYSLDLSSVQYAIFSFRGNSLTSARTRTKILGTGVRNKEPLENQYDGVVFILPKYDDVTKYQRLTVKVKYFDADGKELSTAGGGAMIVLAYDPEGDLEGPEMGTGPNTPLKEFNLGGSSTVHTDKGSRIRLSDNPGAILVQVTNIASVKYFELSEVTFHD